jgi:uncharacterized protein YjbI with pentapeptide repeats
VNATSWRRATAWLPWALVGISAAAALFGAWWITGTESAVTFLTDRWPWLLIGASAAVVVSVFVWWLWWRLPKRQVERLRHAIRDPKARTDVEDNYRKTAGQLLGGAAVLLGAALAYLQFTQQQQAAHDLLISNQVSKGFEQLGSDKRPIRLGGVYALEGVMNTSEQYHQPVLEALCAFVRDETRTKTGGDTAPITEVEAALTVIGRRKSGNGWVSLIDVHISRADLTKANLFFADLSGSDLRHADFYRVDLRKGILRNADLSGAILFRTDLRKAELNDAYLNGAKLPEAQLSGADLSRADLSGADLSRADLRGAQHLTQGQLDGACGDEETKLDPPLTIKSCLKQ